MSYITIDKHSILRNISGYTQDNVRLGRKGLLAEGSNPAEGKKQANLVWFALCGNGGWG